MALQQCPECGGQVSSSAQACPHCGYPISEQSKSEYYIVYRGRKIDIEHIAKRLEEYGADDLEATFLFSDLSIKENILFDEMNRVYDEIKQKYGSNSPSVYKPQPTNIPKCPTCGSTQITKQNVVSRAVGGFLFGAFSPEGRMQFVCQKCGYKW